MNAPGMRIPETINGVEQRGDSDCLRACLATILNIAYEDVPAETALGESTSQNNAMVAFLASHGLTFAWFGMHGTDRPMLMFGPRKVAYHPNLPGYWLGSVRSPRNDDGHVVVMRGDRIVWDPHPQRAMGHRGFEGGWLLMPRNLGNWRGTAQGAVAEGSLWERHDEVFKVEKVYGAFEHDGKGGTRPVTLVKVICVDPMPGHIEIGKFRAQFEPAYTGEDE